MKAGIAGGVLHGVGTPCAASDCGPGAAGPYRRDHEEGRLWLVRDTRRGDKAHDEQRRLERYREQEPGA